MLNNPLLGLADLLGLDSTEVSPVAFDLTAVPTLDILPLVVANQVIGNTLNVAHTAVDATTTIVIPNSELWIIFGMGAASIVMNADQAIAFELHILTFTPIGAAVTTAVSGTFSNSGATVARGGVTFSPPLVLSAGNQLLARNSSITIGVAGSVALRLNILARILTT